MPTEIEGAIATAPEAATAVAVEDKVAVEVAVAAAAEEVNNLGP